MTKEELIKLKEEIVNNEDKLKALKRLAISLSNEEYESVLENIDNGKKTGYATLDKPWDAFYQNIEKKSMFLNTTPYQGVFEANKNYPNEKALEYFGTNISFGKLIKNIDIVAKSLQEYGVKKGDFVTICSTTTPEVVYIFYAISKIGAIANVIAPFYSPEELLARIGECDSNVIIIVDKFFPKFKDVLNKEKKKSIIVLPMMNSSLLRLFSKKYRIDGKTNEVDWNFFINDGKHREDAKIDPYELKKPQAMVYSSGTTGPSKGILLSVDSFQKLVNAYGNSDFDTTRLQSVYQNIPAWSTTGLSLGINFPLSYGVKVCIDPRFDRDIFVKNVLKFKPEYILTITSMYQGFTTEENLKRINGKSLSFLKYPVEGGEALTEKDIQNIEQVFRSHGSKARLLNGYGLCECGATITTDITSHKFSNNASGIPLRDIVTVGIFDDNYRELKYKEIGNILVKTDIGMIGYLKKPEETKKFFYVDCNGDCWSKTDDIGYINDDGSLVVLGRKNDYSVIDGIKVYNFDIERAILKSKYVKLCEVQSHPNDENVLVAHIVWDNEVKNILEKKPDMLNYYLKEIQQIVLENMKIPESVPHYFCVKNEFPSAFSGKRDIKVIKNDISNIIKLD